MRQLTEPSPPLDVLASENTGVSRDRTQELFAQVMGLVALTVATTALGAYVGRDLSGGAGIAFFVGAIICVIGLDVASRRGREQLAVGLLLGLGLALGLAVAPLLAEYAKAEPAVLWQAAGATAAFVAALGALGYATRRDLSSWARALFWGLLGLIAFGIVGLFVSIPNGNLIYCVGGLLIFGAFTVVDFNRLRRREDIGAAPIAAGIFLDIFNLFLLFLDLFGGGGRE
jgi:modulator of FtsH protease